MTESKGGFFSPPIDMIEDLTQVKGNKNLVKAKAPKKQYTCSDCLRCSHAKKKVRDEEKCLPEIKDENGDIVQKEHVEYKWVEIGGSPALGVQGLGGKKILIIADELTENGLESGKSIVGQERRLLSAALKEVGLNLEQDCWLVSSIRGWKPNMSKSSVGVGSKACKNILMSDIERLQPKVILTTGFRSLSTILSGHGPSVNKDWEKYCAVDETAIPDQILGRFLIPTLSLRDMIFDIKNRKKAIQGYAKRSEKEKGYISKYHLEALDPTIPIATNRALWNDDILLKWKWILRAMRTVIKYLDKPFPIDTTANRVEKLIDKQEIFKAIDYFMKQSIVGTDIETPSLKPYRKGNKIFCIGFSDGKRTVGYSTKDPEIIERTKKLLTSKKTRFIIHNLAFEWKWFKRIWGIECENIYVDSLIMQHAWDHRTGCSGLKYSVFTNYGVSDEQYDGKCKPFFNVCDADKKGPYAKSEQAFNKFDNALKRGRLFSKGLLYPLEGETEEIIKENERREKELKKGYLTEEEQLQYVGMDSEFCFRLAMTIRPKLSPKEREAVRFYTDGVIMLAHVTDNGMKINKEQLLENIKLLDIQAQELHYEILKTEEVKAWKEHILNQISRAKTQAAKKKLEDSLDFNYNSNTQLSKLLFDILGYKGVKKTASGAWSTDAGTLEKFDSEVCKLIVKRKKLLKSKDTYLSGWIREADDDNIVHPNFNLGSLTSHRSSSNSVNSQNSPKRNKEMKVLTRNFIVPHTKTQKIISGDYSGAETRCMASIANDPQMRIYMEDSKNNDMHRDSTIDVFQLDGTKYPSDLLEELRGIIKNGFVFPLFYGDYYGNCAVNIWEALRSISEENKNWLEKHFISIGITNLDIFTEHLKECERILWKVRFKKIDSWKAEGWKKFVEQEYIETVIGFRLRGRLNSKQCGNYRIQGPSWAVLLQGMIYLDKEMRKLGLKSKIINEIHDDCITSTEDSEIEIMKKLYVENLLIKARQAPLFKDWMDVKFLVEMEIHDQGNLSWATKPSPLPVKEEDYIKDYITA